MLFASFDVRLDSLSFGDDLVDVGVSFLSDFAVRVAHCHSEPMDQGSLVLWASGKLALVGRVSEPVHEVCQWFPWVHLELEERVDRHARRRQVVHLQPCHHGAIAGKAFHWPRAGARRACDRM